MPKPADQNDLSTSTIVLDGGMGRELERMGAPFRQPEWSALALYESPESVAHAHRNFIQAGAQVITANNYAVVPFHLGEERFRQDGARLAQLAAKIARKEADSAPHWVKVAGSLPPAMGSYRPDLFDEEAARDIHQVLVDVMAPYVDIWLAETTSSLSEAREVTRLLQTSEIPVWLSFTLEDSPLGQQPIPEHPVPVLRSGESLEDAIRLADAAGVERLLFNCSQPEVISRALIFAKDFLEEQGMTLALGAYANAFVDEHDEEGANEEITALRKDLVPERYAILAEAWIKSGATAIGGCCGIGPEYIKCIAEKVKY
ncbi:Bifunctional homocysteine S-methyltransferase/5,10-methylenetetrahydrofolate reductase [Halomonadaceae bacterium LMG 33818]|uniref:homocysteine S-methyltransferase family protein n=1 Tax=Cernens ardua TaxID=3402176 RepID=UPI003EDC0F3F